MRILTHFVISRSIASVTISLAWNNQNWQLLTCDNQSPHADPCIRQCILSGRLATSVFSPYSSRATRGQCICLLDAQGARGSVPARPRSGPLQASINQPTNLTLPFFYELLLDQSIAILLMYRATGNLLIQGPLPRTPFNR